MAANRARMKREVLRREMIATFNLLVDAVALEKHFDCAYARQPSDDALQQWKLCRRTVTQVGQDYARALSRYRMAVRVNFASRRSGA